MLNVKLFYKEQSLRWYERRDSENLNYLTLTMLDIVMYYTPPQFLTKWLTGFKSLLCIYKQSVNSVDPDQLASQKPADLDLHHFQNRIC